MVSVRGLGKGLEYYISCDFPRIHLPSYVALGW